MLKPQIRTRINKDKLSRYSSQLALRKSLVQCATPKESDNTELSNIKKTFWMKKTGNPLGTENLPPNCKRMNSSRNGQSLSIKMLTKNSESNSIYYKMGQNERNQQSDSKLVVIEKYQKQLISQAKILINEQIPKLATCHKIFHSLNKSIKMVFQNCNKFIKSKLQTMFNNHLQITYELFMKIIKYSAEFIHDNKCVQLITKNIQLEKQNTKLLDLQFKQLNQDYQEWQHKINQKVKDNLENSNIKCIDYQRVLLANYKVSDFRPNIKLNQLCSGILKPFMNFHIKKQIGQFQLINHIIKNLTQSREANGLLKKISNDLKNKKPASSLQNLQKNKNQQSLSKSTILDILLYKFDFHLFEILKNKIIKLANEGYLKHLNQTKISIKEILQIFNKFNILGNNEKIKQIAGNLLGKSQLKGRTKFTQKEIGDICNYFDENHILIFQNIIVPIQKNSGLHQSVNRATKINSLSNKRFINCASLYQSKNIKTNHISKKPSIQGITSQQFINNKLQIYPSLFTDTYLDDHQTLFLLYWFVVQQFQYLQITTFTLFKMLSQTQCLAQFNKVLQKLMEKSIFEKLHLLHRSQKEAIFELAQRLIKAYNNDLKEQFTKLATAETFNYLKSEVLDILSGQQKKLFLNELVVDNNKAETFQSTQIHAFDQIQIPDKS